MATITKPASAQPAFRSRLVTLASGGAAVAYALFVFVPGQHTITGMHRQIEEKRTQIANSTALARPMQELTEQAAAAERLKNSWRSRVPRSSLAAPVFAQVIRHAKETGAEVMSFAPQTEQPLETIGLIPVALQAEGSYRSLHELLEKLESMRGLVWIDEVHFQPQDREQERLGCTLKLIIFTNCAEISG